MRIHTLDYLFNGEPRTYEVELKQDELSVHEAALHLLQLHFGDGENGLVMPSADAAPDEIMAQAELLGLSRIRNH